MNRRGPKFLEGAVVATFVDQYGDTQTIHKGKNALAVKRPRLTPALEATNKIAIYLGERIREERELRGWTLEELGIKAGIAGTPKNRIWEIEKGVRNGGIRFGTLYVIAAALGVEPIDLMPPVSVVLS